MKLGRIQEIKILSRYDFHKEFKKLNEKTEDQSYKSGCLMGYFATPFKNPKIDKKDIYDNDEHEYGLEIEPHVTILYGLDDKKINEDELVKLFSLIEGPEVSTSKISLFKNDKYDVVKWDIDSEELAILNKMVTSMFPYKSDYPDYHAHSTIFYGIKGKCDDYCKIFKKPFTKKIDYWVYSKANGRKIKIVPGKEPEVIRKAK